MTKVHIFPVDHVCPIPCTLLLVFTEFDFTAVLRSMSEFEYMAPFRWDDDGETTKQRCLEMALQKREKRK